MKKTLTVSLAAEGDDFSVALANKLAGGWTLLNSGAYNTTITVAQGRSENRPMFWAILAKTVSDE